MKKLTFLTALFFVFQLCIFGQIPVGYYNSIDGKMERELKTALYKILRDHTVLRYNDLWYYFNSTDRHPGTNQVWDMYSSTVRNFGSNPNASVSGMNKEHSLPKSWWGTDPANTTYPSYTDLNHLYPGDAAANLAKSNYMLGVVDDPRIFNNDVSRVGMNVFAGGTARNAFEPADEYKGDFARTYMYMVTCYEDFAPLWRSDALYMFNGNEKYPVFQNWSKEMLLQWSREDPVSQKEKDRNEEVFGFQNNRNPFIDFPELAEYIWGDCTSCPFDLPPDLYANAPTIVTPVNETEIYFGEVQKGSEVAQTLVVKGLYLTSNVYVMLLGTNADFFNISTQSIPAGAANAEEGYPLEISYLPTEYGEHSAQLVIYGGGITGSYSVFLNGVGSVNSSVPPPVGADFNDLYVENNTINFRTYSSDSPVFIYDSIGKLVYSEKGTGEWEEYKTPQAGIYIICYNGKSRKVVVY